MALAARRVLTVLLGISLVFIALDIGIQTAHDLWAPAFPGWETAAIILDADREASLPTWWGIFLLVVAAATSAAAALAEPARTARRSLWSLAAIFLLLSADEQAMIHEHAIVPLRDRFGFGGLLFYAWVVPALVAVAALVIVYARFVFSRPPWLRNLLVIAAGLFLTGALGLEMLGGWWAENHSDTDLTYQTITSIEEALEYLGASVYIYALLRYVGTLRGAIVLRPTP